MNRLYEIFGLSESATDEEIDAKYRALKEEYGEKRFSAGSEGEEAARKLSELENAYSEIKFSRFQAGFSDNVVFSEVEEAIKQGDLSRAQTALDSIGERNAEWHYLQSFVYYKKNWMNECKKQLEIAVSMDASNPKYKKALDSMNERMKTEQERVFTSGNARQGGARPVNNGQMGGDGLANCCTTYLCCSILDCLCCGR